jgi:hypothetical protein
MTMRPLRGRIDWQRLDFVANAAHWPRDDQEDC